MVSDADRLAAEAARAAAAGLHTPVLLNEVTAALAPALAAGPDALVIDGTFGAGGYARALLEAGAGAVLGLDRDPEAITRGAAWAALYEGRLMLAQARFGAMEAALEQAAPGAAAAGRVHGVVLDLGVSSMQIDVAERGFSFLRDGPLDMRMSGAGAEARAGAEIAAAAEIINSAPERALADILFQFGEERAARRIARAIVAARPLHTTAALADVIVSATRAPRPGAPHPATRAFQALRIAVNDELGELVRGLAAAEALLAPEGVLAVVTFHSLEDRIVKRFLHARAGRGGGGSRHEPVVNLPASTFALMGKALTPGPEEIGANPRARSATLRAARRTAAPAFAPLDAAAAAALGAPALVAAAVTPPER